MIIPEKRGLDTVTVLDINMELGTIFQPSHSTLQQLRKVVLKVSTNTTIVSKFFFLVLHATSTRSHFEVVLTSTQWCSKVL